MSIDNRLWMFLFFILGVGMLVVLASGLSDVEFQAGQVFVPSDEDIDVAIGPTNFRAWNLAGIWKVLGLIILWVIFPLSFIYFITSPEARKTILRRALTLGVTGYALFFLMRSCNRVITPDQFDFGSLAESTLDADNPLETYFSPQTAQLLEWIANLFFIIILAVIIWRLMRWWSSRPQTLDEIGTQASQALEDLRSGADLQDRITQCYIEMSRVLLERKGIRRDRAMTAREFEAELEEIGLPGDALQTLTRLFEKARYGSSQPDPGDQKDAERSLQMIVASVRENA
jgi:hypothetical protein